MQLRSQTNTPVYENQWGQSIESDPIDVTPSMYPKEGMWVPAYVINRVGVDFAKPDDVKTLN